jgi:hypothetical protein
MIFEQPFCTLLSAHQEGQSSFPIPKNQCLANTYYLHGFATICENGRHSELLKGKIHG